MKIHPIRLTAVMSTGQKIMNKGGLKRASADFSNAFAHWP